MKLHHLRVMNRVKLSLNLDSYYYNKNYKSVYLFGKLINNIIFDNQIVEEKSARIKVVFKTENPIDIIQTINKNLVGQSWFVNLLVDPTTVSKPLNKDGVRISSFVSEEFSQ